MASTPTKYNPWWCSARHFLFPITIEVGMGFKDLAHIRSAITYEASKREMKDMLIMYQQRFDPSLANWITFRLHCRVCGANVNFARMEYETFVVSSVTTKHSHEGRVWVTRRPRKNPWRKVKKEKNLITIVRRIEKTSANTRDTKARRQRARSPNQADAVVPSRSNDFGQQFPETSSQAPKKKKKTKPPIVQTVEPKLNEE